MRVLYIEDSPSDRKIFAESMKEFALENSVELFYKEELDSFVKDPEHYCLIVTDLSFPEFLGDLNEAVKFWQEHKPKHTVLVSFSGRNICDVEAVLDSVVNNPIDYAVSKDQGLKAIQKIIKLHDYLRRTQCAENKS